MFLTQKKIAAAVSLLFWLSVLFLGNLHFALVEHVYSPTSGKLVHSVELPESSHAHRMPGGVGEDSDCFDNEDSHYCYLNAIWQASLYVGDAKDDSGALVAKSCDTVYIESGTYRFDTLFYAPKHGPPASKA